MGRVSTWTAGLFSVVLLAGTPAMTPMPGAPQPPAGLELLTPNLSTQSRQSCSRRGGSCFGLQRCCEGFYCRENGGGDSICR